MKMLFLPMLFGFFFSLFHFTFLKGGEKEAATTKTKMNAGVFLIFSHYS